MPRHPDPDLEERVLKAAEMLWHRGGDKAMTLRAVARAARTNTPAVYRRFKDRHALVRGLLLRTAGRFRELFEAGTTVEDMVGVYIDYAMDVPHEYELFYNYVHELSRRKGPGRPRPIRESRPNFALLEDRLAKRFGGAPEDHTRLAMATWLIAHGTTTLLLSKAVPEGHEEEFRKASRAAVATVMKCAADFRERD